MTIRVEQARWRDAGQAAEILVDWDSRTPWLPRVRGYEETAFCMREMIGRGWVSVVRSGGVAGFLARDGATIHALYVRRGCRGAGLGRALLDHAKSARPELALWTFVRNRRARAFYEREGFREAERGDGSGNDEKLPDIRYVWRREGVAHG